MTWAAEQIMVRGGKETMSFVKMLLSGTGLPVASFKLPPA